MTVGTARTTVTADELPALSARFATLGKRTELVGGDLVVMAPAAGGRHGQVAHTLALFIGIHVKDRGLGRVFAAETGFLLRRSPDTVRAPDVAFVAGERLGTETPAGFLELAPDLAVDVVSPGDSAAAVRGKVDDWLAAGTRLVWVVYPETRSVVTHRRGCSPESFSAEDILDGAPVFEDFTVRVRELFA